MQVRYLIQTLKYSSSFPHYITPRYRVIKKPHTKLNTPSFLTFRDKMLKQLVKKEQRRVFGSSDDSAIIKQVLATHSPDGREVDLDLLLGVIEETFHHSVPAHIDSAINGGQSETIFAVPGEEKHALLGFDDINGIPDGLASIIHKISCEFSCKCSGGSDAHASTLAILNMLSAYTWEAKVVISLAAFAINFGEFWLVAQLFATNPLAKSIALLKHMPNVIEHYKSLKTRFDAINLLIKAMLDVTKCIITFKNLPVQYIQEDQPPKSTANAHIPTATYWSLKSMVACTSQLTSLLGMNYDRFITATSEAWELSTLAHKVHTINEHLKSILVLCYQNIEMKQHDEYHLMLERIFEATHIDNVKILKALFCAKDDIHPLYHGSSKTRINVDVLRKKTVLLLISDLEISHEEVIALTQIYKQSRTRSELHYEIVWVPVVDTVTWNDSHQHKLEQLQLMMTWHMVHHPNLIEPAVVKYIREKWKFEKKTILVTLDQQGKVQSQNALHMTWIWRNRAYPFTTAHEEALWKEESWTLQLLVDNIDQNIIQWIADEKYICLYGGDNLEWIREFTKTAKEIAQTANIQLEMVYVGKSGTKERIRKTCITISEDKLSHTWADPTSVWYFWTRLESMLYSRTHHGKSIQNDVILKEVLTIMGFDGNDQGWALISKGSAEMARANAETALTTLTEFEKWEGSVSQFGFVAALKGHLETLHTTHHCNRLILPGINGAIPEVVVCAECGRQMEKFFMFRCCTD